ncbi:S9 family peptidase [Microbispora sp. H11081]|uniref:alpha/beta hydrolase family protein n=1 Tax=Microbispora sp. H11081 TaxID=2729107 RepID=UPI001472F9D8|nr:alpha/beta fold hydrolase [Microbispora sp. H11081]
MTTTTAAVPAAARARTRISFSFAHDGSHAACLTGGGGSPLALELWSFTASAADRRILATRHGETTWTQLLCRADGRVLFTRPGRGHHNVVLAEPTATGLVERTLVTIDRPAVRLVATPDRRALALAIGRGETGSSVIWRILDREPWLEQVAELAGTLSGPCPLDRSGALLGLNQQRDGALVRPVAVDLEAGRVRPVPGTTPGQHVLLAAPRSGLLLLAEKAGEGFRLGHTFAGDPAQPRFPDVLDAIEGSVAPMAVDPTGEHVALRVNRGARSHLMIYTPRLDRVRTIPTPPGVVQSLAAWGMDGLRFPFSSPTRPSGVATVDTTTGEWSLVADEGHTWADAEVQEFTGPDGPIEAVVYGDWRTSRHVLVFLHGGPEAATQLEFDPLMQEMAAAGIAVVAPNYRGSTGYGLPHQRALHGAWGGPDLADVRHLARQLSREGRNLMLYGTSYGAYLALLAAGADPGLWSRCVAVSPFLSGESLHAEGSPPVRALIDRLGGRAVVRDDLGPRDVARLCDRITARLLVVHSDNDEVIPVSQSRRLRERLLEAGRHEGRDFVYLEPPTGGHDPIQGGHGIELTRFLLRFLLAG